MRKELLSGYDPSGCYVFEIRGVYGCPHKGPTIGGIVYYVCRGGMWMTLMRSATCRCIGGGGIELYGLSYYICRVGGNPVFLR